MATESISAFFASSGFPLHNTRWSWGSHSNLGVLLCTWSDHLHPSGRYVRVLGRTQGRYLNHSLGLPERIDHLRLLWSGGLAGYAVLATAADPVDEKRTIKTFEREHVHALTRLFEDEAGAIWAELGARVPIARLQRHARTHRTLPASEPFPIATPPRDKPASQAAYLAHLPAMREWLIALAQRKERATYAQARAPFGMRTLEHRNAMSRIGKACEAAGEPILTSLVVDGKTQRCGTGFFSEFQRDEDDERAACYAYWRSAVAGAEAEELRERARQFALAERRPEQAGFRQLVFSAHGGACFVTGCRAVAALDAAHRHGRHWRDGHNRAEDGFLLRKDIHGLYDRGLVRIDPNGEVVFDPKVLDHYQAYTRKPFTG